MLEHCCVGDEQAGSLSDNRARSLARILIGGEGEADVELVQQLVGQRRPLLLSRADQVEDSRGGHVCALGDALDGGGLVRALAQQLADSLENALTALALVALAQARRRS